MAEEFLQLPETLRKMSSTLVHKRTRRTAFICGVIILMSMTSSLNLINFNPNYENTLNSSDSKDNSNIMLKRSLTDSKYGRTQPTIILNFLVQANVNNNFTLNFENKPCDGTCWEDLKQDVESKVSNKTTSILKNLRKNVLQQTKQTLINRRKRDIHKSNKTNAVAGVVVDDNSTTTDQMNHDEDCRHPEYVVFTWVLCLIALATALKLYYLIKILLLIIMLVVYTVLILIPTSLFIEHPNPSSTTE